MKIGRRNFWIYLVGLVVSIILLGIYFIDYQNQWCILSCSVGASGIGAVILAFFIEDSNNRKVAHEKQKTRDELISPILSDLTRIVCMEALIIEQENEELKQRIENKTLVEIIREICKYYDSEMLACPTIPLGEYERYNEQRKAFFEKRKRILRRQGGMLVYAIQDIYSNRSHNICNGLFTDHEIERLWYIQYLLGKIKDSENYFEYTCCYNDFLGWMDCYDPKTSLFGTFHSVKKVGGNFFDATGMEIILKYRSWLNYEIQL